MRTIAFFAILVLSCPYVHASLPERYAGNWANSESKLWEYGFFEDFAIMDGEFWDYGAIEQKRNAHIVKLINGDKETVLTLKPEDGKGIRIAQGKGKPKYYEKAGKGLPAYPNHDTTEFPPARFEADTVVIKGYYRNLSEVPERLRAEYTDKPFQIQIVDKTTGEPVNYFADLDSLGRFEVRFPIVDVSEIFVDWGRLSKRMVVEAGDRIMVYADVAELLPATGIDYWSHVDNPKEILFMGDNARLNSEVIQLPTLQVHIEDYKDKVIVISDMEYARRCLDAHERRTALNAAFYGENPMLSVRTKYYADNRNLYDFYDDLINRYFSLSSSGRQQLDDEYLKLLDEKIDMSDRRLYTLVRNFNHVLEYYPRAVTGSRLIRLTSEMILEEMNKCGMPFANEMEDIQKQIKDLSDAGKTPDDPEMQELIAVVNRMFNQPEYDAMADELLTAMIVRESMDFHKALGDKATPEMRDFLLAIVLNSAMDRSRTPLSQTNMATLEKIELPYLRERLIAMSDYYAELAGRAAAYSQSLGNAEHLSEYTDAERLWEELTAPYRGKVLYVDVWGTWCSPCKMEMKHVKKLKSMLEGEDVVFLYLANRSPETAWKSLIAEYGLAGANVIHYRLPDNQQSMLERKLDVGSYPTYMIFDRNGNLVESKAMRPSQGEATAAQIRKYLKD